MSDLKSKVMSIAYCRGPLCAYANEAVRRLQSAGRMARRLEDGWPEWRLRGHDRDCYSRRVTSNGGDHDASHRLAPCGLTFQAAH